MHVLIGAVCASTTTRGDVCNTPQYTPIVEQDRIGYFLFLKHEIIVGG